jgi:hypothetical protein
VLVAGRRQPGDVLLLHRPAFGPKLVDHRRHINTLELSGLESHHKLSDHTFSARRRGLVRIRRLTIV